MSASLANSARGHGALCGAFLLLCACCARAEGLAETPLPRDTITSLAASPFGGYLLPGLTDPGAVVPVAVGAEHAEVLSAGCNSLVRAALLSTDLAGEGWVFESQPTPPPPDGGFYVNQPHDTIPYATRAVTCSVIAPLGGRVDLAGVVTVSRASLQLIARVTRGAPVPDLEALAADQLLRRPAGFAGQGHRSELAGQTGAMWAVRDGGKPPPRIRPQDRLYWPERSATWSDGVWVVVYVGCSTVADQNVDASGHPTQAADFLADARAAALRAQELAHSRAQLDSELVHGFRQAEVRAGLLTGPTGAPARMPNAPRPLEDAMEPLLPLVMARLGSLASDGAVWLGHDDLWLAAERRPTPEAVRRLVPCAPAECPTLERGAGGGPDGQSTGVLRPIPLAMAGWFEDPVLLWTAGQGRVALTVVSRQAHQLCAVPAPWRGRDLHRDLARALPALLGEYGRRLTLVPVDVRQVEGTDWWCVTPDPDHEVGLLERVRVGDTPWGKCRIYVDPAILHIVFDLPEEEATE